MRRLLTSRGFLFGGALALLSCGFVLIKLIDTVRIWVRTIREVVRTVCEWVSTTIRTVKEVVERLCTALPWPFDALCSLVTRLVEVFETVWNFVCREVIDRVIGWIQVIIEYVHFVLRWVCWIVDWIRSLPEFLACLAGFSPPKFMRVCVRILTDAEGVPAVSMDDANRMMREAAAILRRCNISLIVDGPQLIQAERFLSVSCNTSDVFSDFFVWFSQHACAESSTVTVFMIENIEEPPGGNVLGCSYPVANWIIVEDPTHFPEYYGTRVVHEIGHLAGHFWHTSDPNNIMTGQPAGGTADQVTSFQCCLFRTSQFASIIGPID